MTRQQSLLALPVRRIISILLLPSLGNTPPAVSAVEPLLPKRRFGFAHFHLRDVASDSGGGYRGLELFVLRFHLRFVFVRPDPDKFILRPVDPGADDGDADLFVQWHDVFFEVLEKIIHLALVDRVNAGSATSCYSPSLWFHILLLGRFTLKLFAQQMGARLTPLTEPSCTAASRGRAGPDVASYWIAGAGG